MDNVSYMDPQLNLTDNPVDLKITLSLQVIYSGLIAFLLVVGIPGNLLVIYVVGRYTAMQTTTNLYLMSLSIADLLHLVQIIFVISVVYKEHFIFGKWLCKLHLTLEAANSLAVTFILTATSIDRYLAVCHPIKSQVIRSPKVTRKIIVLIWIICLLLLSPLFIYAGLTTSTKNNETVYQCQVHLEEKHLIFTQYTFVLGFAIPVCAISVFYFLVISKLRNINRANISRSKDRRDSVHRIIRMILALIVIYIALWFPYWIHQWTINYNIIKAPYNFYVGLIAQFLVYLNSSINPILYAFLSQNFRVMFVQILNCQTNRFFFDTFSESFVMKRGRSVMGQFKSQTSNVATTNKTALSIDNHIMFAEDKDKDNCTPVVFLETHLD